MSTPGGLVDKQELIDAQLDTAHLGRVVNSKDASGAPINTSTNRTGGVNKTLDALEAEYQGEIDSLEARSDQLIIDKTAELDSAITDFETEATQTITDANVAFDAQREGFEATFSSQFAYNRIGNISDYVGQSLPEADKLNSYQYPDNSGEWYGPIQGQTFPITIPANPSTDNGWALVNNQPKYKGLWPDTGGEAFKGDTFQTQVGGAPTGQYFEALQDTLVDPIGDDVNWREVVSVDSLSQYTDTVYKASGGNSAVENMIASATVGGRSNTGLGEWIRVSDYGDISDFIAVDNKVGLKDFIGVSVDDAINESFNFIKQTGGEILLDTVYEYNTQLSFDTSVNKWEVAFVGTGTRTSGIRYVGSDSPGDWALTIGADGVAQSGYVSFLNCGVYGDGQEINGVRLFKAQRYQRFNEITVRNFNGMLLKCGDGDVFLNTWGNIFLLNGCRACDLGSEFNANNISNIIIENMTLISGQYTDEIPVCKIDGIGTFIDMVSIESCSSDVMLDISKSITIGALYQEANHGANLGVNARCVVTHGSNPKILSGDIKLPGVNANTSGFYVIDLDDSDKAQLDFVVRTPTPNPNSYQKPILWGTSKRAELNIKWDMFDGIGYPSRRENAAFDGENRENSIVNGVKRIFGQDPELIGRQLMTSYCINIMEGRVLYPNSNNRASGYIEQNISPSSRLENGFGFSQRKDVMKISRNLTSGDFGLYKDYALIPNKKYMFSTIVGRKSVDNARPRMRVTDLSGTQDYFIEPRDPFFTGWTQISVVTTLNDASNVRFWPITAVNNIGDNYLAMAFIIDLEQFEQDHGVSFDGMTTKEIEDLINPSYISEEFGRQYRGTLPDSGKWNRGERVYNYPPTAGQPEGWVCSVSGDFDATPPAFLAMANLS